MQCELFPPEILEAIGCQLRITDGVLDVAMPEIGLQRPGVDAGRVCPRANDLRSQVRRSERTTLCLSPLMPCMGGVCTERSNSDVLMMQPADEGLRYDASDPLDRSR